MGRPHCRRRLEAACRVVRAGRVCRPPLHRCLEAASGEVRSALRPKTVGREHFRPPVKGVAGRASRIQPSTVRCRRPVREVVAGVRLPCPGSPASAGRQAAAFDSKCPVQADVAEPRELRPPPARPTGYRGGRRAQLHCLRHHVPEHPTGLHPGRLDQRPDAGHGVRPSDVHLPRCLTGDEGHRQQLPVLVRGALPPRKSQAKNGPGTL